jgi:chromosome segregation ATPase
MRWPWVSRHWLDEAQRIFKREQEKARECEDEIIRYRQEIEALTNRQSQLNAALVEKAGELFRAGDKMATLEGDLHGMEHAQIDAEKEIAQLKTALEAARAHQHLAETRYHDVVKQLIAPKLAPPEPAKVEPSDKQGEDVYREEERLPYSPGFKENLIQGLMNDKDLSRIAATRDAEQILADLNGDMSYLTEEERAQLNV